MARTGRRLLSPGPEEEDDRVKNAREGKAIHVPGKTVEDMQAEPAAEAEARAVTSSRTIALSESDWSELDTAIPDIIETLHDVYFVMLTLSYENDLDQPGVNSMLRLAARAVMSMEEREVRVLDRLDQVIRHANRGGRS